MALVVRILTTKFTREFHKGHNKEWQVIDVPQYIIVLSVKMSLSDESRFTFFASTVKTHDLGQNIGRLFPERGKMCYNQNVHVSHCYFTPVVFYANPPQKCKPPVLGIGMVTAHEMPVLP